MEKIEIKYEKGWNVVQLAKHIQEQIKQGKLRVETLMWLTWTLNYLEHWLKDEWWKKVDC